ncbi:MAG: ABC transporter substrate-binding protein [Anaerolineae bacterium]
MATHLSRTYRMLSAVFIVLLVVALVAACSPAPAPATSVPAEPTAAVEEVVTEPTEAEEEVAAEPTEASEAEEASEEQAAPQLSGEINLLFWMQTPGMDEAMVDKLPAAFQAKYPGTTINTTLVGSDYDSKLALLMSAGDPPDIIMPGGDFGRYVAEGLVLPLDDLILNDPILGDPALARTNANETVRTDGVSIYGTHWSVLCGTQLYYNRDLFDAAGLDYPNNDWTWDDYLEAAQKLTITEGDEIVQYGTAWGYLPGWDGGWAPIVWSYGGEIWDSPYNPTEFRFDSPEVVAAWQWMQDLVYKWKVAPTPAAADILSEAGGPLLSGRVAMVIDGCWMMGPYDAGNFELGMSERPKGPAGGVGGVWYAGGTAITQGSDNKELAWEYLRWLAVDKEANEIIASLGQTCGAPWVREFDDLYATSWREVPGGEACMTSLDDARPATIYHPKWAEIWTNIITPEWDKFTNGSITAQEFADAINGPANEALTSE